MHLVEKIPPAAFPEPFEIQYADGHSPVICLVEHARNTIPAELNGLGVSAHDLQDHIAWDIGIEAVTRRLSDSLRIPSIYCLYSRLIIDVNRPPDHPELIRPESDGVRIPGNENLSPADRAARQCEIYNAYHAAADALVDRVLAAGVHPLVLGMHSCTPCLRQGAPRPWQIGLSTYDSDEMMMEMASLLNEVGLNVGIHEPYDMREYDGVSLDLHGRARGLPQILVEIRQDLIVDVKGARTWAQIMERMLCRLLP